MLVKYRLLHAKNAKSDKCAVESQIERPHSPTNRDNNVQACLSGSDRNKKLRCLLLILPLIDGKRLLTVI